MNPQPTQSVPAASAPVSAVLDRYVEVAVYLLVLAGFATLAATGSLGAPATLLVGAAILFRGYGIATRRNLLLSQRWTTILTLGYVVFYLADYLVISGEFLGSTVHLVLSVMLIRLYSARRERDAYFLAVIAFLMVLAAAMLTVSSMFLIAFAGFLLISVATFILMEMKRASSRTTGGPKTNSGVPAGKLKLSLAKTAPALMLLIMIGAAVVFFVLPRVTAGYFSAYSPRNQISTGFSDRVELGQIGEIQQSGAVVMHIQVDGDLHDRLPMKWRGVALNLFDGRSWSNPHEQYPAMRRPDGRFALTSSAIDAQQVAFSPESDIIHYRVLAEPMGTNVFFLAPIPTYLQGNYRYIARDDEGAVFDMDPEHPLTVYDAWSNLGRPAPQLLRGSSRNLSERDYPAGMLLKYLQVPVLDPRIPRLAQKVAGSLDNSYDKAAAIESYLRSHYGYTLQLSRTMPRDPLANFLFERKQGHCEYFASAMAIMLRTLNIPSRVVNGFSGGEFNDLTSQYVIRASDAHSWVEAYFPGSGWVTFDPTPPSASPSHTGWGRIALYADAVSSFWREWVVNYDAAHQQTVASTAADQGRHALFDLRHWYRRHYRRLLASARRLEESLSGSPSHGLWIVFSIALALILLLTRRRLIEALRKARLAARPQTAPRMAATVWYERLTRKMERSGWKKTPSQTPSEFARSIKDRAIRASVEQFTRHYENARFGNSAPDAAQLPELYEEVVEASRR